MVGVTFEGNGVWLEEVGVLVVLGCLRFLVVCLFLAALGLSLFEYVQSFLRDACSYLISLKVFSARPVII